MSSAVVHPNDREKVSIIKDFPPRLKAALIARAKRDESNMNDVAVGILAHAFRVRYKGGSGRPSRASTSPTVTFSMPERLHTAIKVRAARESTTARALIIDALSAELRPPRKKAA